MNYNFMGTIGNKTANLTVKIPEAQIDNRFDSLGVNGLGRLMNKWMSCELDALDAKLMSVCRYQKKKYLNLPLFLEFFPNLRQLRQNTQRLFFDFFDLTSSSYVTPKQLVGCLSVIMFVPKQLFGEVVLANVFFRGSNCLTQSEFDSFIDHNKHFELVAIEKKVVKQTYVKQGSVSFKEFNVFVATHYNIVKYVRLFDFYDTNLELDELVRLKNVTAQQQQAEAARVGVQNLLRDLVRVVIFQQDQPRIRIKLKRGCIVYLVGTDWFFMWIRYIQIYGCTEVVFENQVGEEHRFCEDSLAQQLNQHWISRPQRINNIPLLGEYEQDLRPQLQIYKDFIPIPQGLWTVFQKVYGGGPQIRRVYPQLTPMVIYKVSLNSACQFKNEVKRKMHLQSSAIQRVFDPQQRAKDPDAKIYVKKVQDYEWSEMQKEMVLMNRSLDHGFVTKVPQRYEREFLEHFSGMEGNKTIQYGMRLPLQNCLYNREETRVMSTDGKTAIVHYLGKPWRCDTEFKVSELTQAISQQNYVPKPVHELYGLPTLYEENSNYYRFITPVLECLITTPYFTWYLERKKYVHALAEPYRQKHSITARLSEMAERFKVKKDKGECKEDLGKVIHEFFRRNPKYIQFAQQNVKVFPNEFLQDFLTSMSQQLSVQQCLLQAHPRQGMTSLADQKFPIIPKFFSAVQSLKMVCDQCKSEQISPNQTYILELPVSQDDQILYEAIFRSKMGEFTKYAIRIRKTMKFKEYVTRFSRKIKVDQTMLAFAEIENQEFRKHFGENDYESTLLVLGLNETDRIYIFQMDSEVTELRNSKLLASNSSQRSLPSRGDLTPDTYVDFNIYSDWQVGRIKTIDRDKATIVSFDGEASVDFRRIRNFKEKTREKPLFRIDVLHRKYSQTTHKIEYFLIPSIVNVGEWMTWAQVVPIIAKQALLFINKSQVQPPMNILENSMMNISRRRMQRAPSDQKYPFRIRVMLNNYGEICYICEKKIKIFTEDAPLLRQEKYCKGCELNGNVPIGLVMNLRKICFTVDWERDFIFQIPNKINEDQSYMIQRAYVDKFSNTLMQSLKGYSQIGVKMQIKCQKCQYSQGILKRFVQKTPNILILHLNRFKRTKDDFIKFHNKINFPERLSLSKITLNSDSANDSYQLYGLVGLIDNDVDKNSWYSVFQKGRGVWVYSEGEKALLCDLKDVKNNEVYMLFYRKVNVEGTLITTIL